MKKVVCVIVHSFLLLTTVSRSMELPDLTTLVATKIALAKFQKKISVWDPKKITFSDAKLPLSIPKNLIITPDEKGAIIASRGAVDYINFKTPPAVPFSLIKHTHNAYCPMVAVAMQSNRLVVVSVLNSKKEEQKAQCIISYSEILRQSAAFSNRWYEEKEIDSPVQAVTLSSDGNILAIASQDSIHIYDLQEFSSCSKKFFMPRMHRDNKILDISEAIRVAPGSNDQHIAAVNDEGVIDFKRISKRDDNVSVQDIKGVKTGDSIKRIHLFNTQELLYVTTNGEVKIIDPNDWLEHFQGNIKDRIISHHENGKAAVDQGLNYGTIHWIDSPDFSESVRFKIFVHRENNTSVEDFVVSVPDNVNKTYNCITATGQKASRPMHILTAALRGDSVVALLADGNLYWWQLPKKYQAPTEFMVKNPTSITDRLSNRSKGDNKSGLKPSPSSPAIPSLSEVVNKTRNRSSTTDAGDKKSDNPRNSIKISRSKDKSNTGAKELFKVSSPSPRKDPFPGRKTKKKDYQNIMDILNEDTINDSERSEKK